MRKMVGFFVALFLMVGVSAQAAELHMGRHHGLILAEKKVAISSLKTMDDVMNFSVAVVAAAQEHPCLRLPETSSARKHIPLFISTVGDMKNKIVTLIITTEPRSCF